MILVTSYDDCNHSSQVFSTRFVYSGNASSSVLGLWSLSALYYTLLKPMGVDDGWLNCFTLRLVSFFIQLSLSLG